MEIGKILTNFPLRISLTNYCNAHCFFCSNEGMPITYKNSAEIDCNDLAWIIHTLSRRGLKNISLTGGEPILYSKLDDLLKIIAEYRYDDLFFHTNGLLLKKDIVAKLIESGFTKIAVSLHSPEYKIWRQITGGSKSQFLALQENIEYLKNKEITVEIKQVIVKDVDDSPKLVRRMLDFCSDRKLKLKFLNLEPISDSQVSLKDNMDDVKKTLKNLGCKKFTNIRKFRGQKEYLPIHRFKYKNTQGVLIDLLCGRPAGCENCYKSNEIYLTPKLTIKPCHMSNFELDLNSICRKKDEDGLIKKIIESRIYLKTRPGIGKKFWSENHEKNPRN